MLVLVLNAGSSSLKYQLINMQDESILAKGNCERIGIDGRISHTVHGEKHVFENTLANHTDALSTVIDLLTKGEFAVISSIGEIGAIGHRIAQGLEGVDKAEVIDERVWKDIESTVPSSPLHTPAMLNCIASCTKLFGKDQLQVAVFDTSFHSTMPPKAYIYGIPYEYYKKYGIRRYGYHGTSHKYVSLRLAKLLGKKPEDLKIVSCHLGNGSSVTAIDGGKSIDTSMGYTPTEGLIMGTRCGTIDPTIAFTIAENENLSLQEVKDILLKKSGLFGISGVSSDDRDVGIAAEEGNERAKLTGQVLRYQIKKYIGSYAAAMNGLDGLLFTGGIGEKSWELREEVCSNMEFFGIKLDKQKNKELNGQEACISAADSKVPVWIIPTNEEKMIARETYEIALNK